MNKFIALSIAILLLASSGSPQVVFPTQREGGGLTLLDIKNTIVGPEDAVVDTNSKSKLVPVVTFADIVEKSNNSAKAEIALPVNSTTFVTKDKDIVTRTEVKPSDTITTTEFYATTSPNSAVSSTEFSTLIIVSMSFFALWMLL